MKSALGILLLGFVMLPHPIFAHVQPVSFFFEFPDGDILTGGWTTTPLWSDIDEPGIGDGNLILSPVTPTTPANDLQFDVTNNLPADSWEIISTCLYTRLRKTGGKSASVILDILDHTGFLISTRLIVPTTSFADFNPPFCSPVFSIYTASEFEDFTIRLKPNVFGGGSATAIEVEFFRILVNMEGPFPDLPVDVGLDMVTLSYTALLIGFLSLGFFFRAGIFFIAAIFIVSLLMLQFDVMMFYLIGAGLIASFIFLGATVTKE